MNARIARLIKEEFDIDELPDCDVPLGQIFDINSVSNLVLVVLIESEIGILLNSRDIHKDSTVSGIAELIDSRFSV